MRNLLVFVALTCSLFLQAQSFKPSGKDSGYLPHMQNRKWFVTSYSSVGIGFSVYNGGSATVISAPVGLQLNRKLNDNLYAFTGVSLAPTFVNFNHAFLSPGIKSNAMNGFKSDYLGLNPSVNMGLMYVNDARTFSVSGSIQVQRTYYPMLPYYSPVNGQPINSSAQPPVRR